ncbi:MAG: hypothetical protein U5K56_07345 [Halioglobus sp.]|nr:hypothetical protein [Halioglobus sp.]
MIELVRTLVTLLAIVMMAIIFMGDIGTADPVDLGVAVYPPGSTATPATRHAWRVDRRGAEYGVGYFHDVAAMAALKADHVRHARENRFKRLVNDRFTWRSPPGCAGREWECIYRRVYRRSTPDLEPLLNRFEAYARAEQWTSAEIARWLLAFVQQIEYRLPREYAFGLLPPALVASQSWGDCDSKSLLLIHFLDRFGIESVLLVSEVHSHALVGIDVPTSGDGFRHRGRRYAWAETTAQHAPRVGFTPS